MFRVELMWNREFDWVQWYSVDTKERAVGIAREAVEMGDGARVKKARVLDDEDNVVYKC